MHEGSVVAGCGEEWREHDCCRHIGDPTSVDTADHGIDERGDDCPTELSSNEGANGSITEGPSEIAAGRDQVETCPEERWPAEHA